MECLILCRFVDDTIHVMLFIILRA